MSGSGHRVVHMDIWAFAREKDPSGVPGPRSRRGAHLCAAARWSEGYICGSRVCFATFHDLQTLGRLLSAPSDQRLRVRTL